MKRLWITQKIARLLGYFFCPMCEKFSRTKTRYFIGGHHICSRCEGEIINQKIKSWYGDFK